MASLRPNLPQPEDIGYRLRGIPVFLHACQPRLDVSSMITTATSKRLQKHFRSVDDTLTVARYAREAAECRGT